MEGRAWLKDAQVLSEVHLECQPEDSSSLSRASTFTICPPQTDSAPEIADDHEICEPDEPDSGTICGVDENGDLIVPRQRRHHLPPARSNHDSVLVYHHMATVIPQVGLQIWRGALLLADYILHRMPDFQDITAVELGAGTGLVGIVLARQAKLVFITDKDAEILDNCSRNVFANEDSFRYGEATVRVRELDWQLAWPPQVSKNPKGYEASYAWNEDDLADVQDATLLLAADVIYADDLTDGFFGILRKLMPAGSRKLLYLGLEKRYNFSMDDMDVVANGYANFLRHLNVEGNEQSMGTAEADFVGRRLELLSISKYIQEYDRGKDLELWEIRRCNNVDKSQEIIPD